MSKGKDNTIFFELGFEELPVSALKLIQKDLTKKILDFFESEKVKNIDVQLFLTPRRLVLFIKNLPEKTPAIEKIEKGPQENLFFEDNRPTKLAEGFMKSRKLNPSDIEIKDGFVWYKKLEGGVEISSLFIKNIFNLVNSLEFEKRMKWDDTNIVFPRPIRWVNSFFNNQQLEIKIGNLVGANFTYGNRNTGNLKIPFFNGYDFLEKTKDNYVVLSFEERKQMIVDKIKDISENQGLSLIWDEELLEEVTYLVEYPVIFKGKFDNRFLYLPKEIIIAALKQHQRYFTLENEKGELSNYFIFVANSPYASYEDIVKNNQRIINSRLEDAEFYFKNDIARSMDEYENRLKKTIFCEGFGSFYEKVERNVKLVEYIFGKMKMEYDPQILKEAGIISKFDIATDMIKDGKEFTKLQGRIGYHYARLKGFDENLSKISYEHYLPVNVDGDKPKTLLGKIFSISDKVDNISVAFVSGNKPTGSKDIMYVRRDTLSLLSLLVYENIEIDLYEIFKFSLELLNQKDHLEKIIDYVKKRMEIFLQDYHSIPYDISRSLLQSSTFITSDIKMRAEKILNLKNDFDFRRMVEGQKRVSNILKNISHVELKDKNFENVYEKDLYEKGKDVLMVNKKYFETKDYDSILKNLLSLVSYINDFFDNVLVNDQDEQKKNKRLALLFFIKNIFMDFADFSYIVFEHVDLKKEKL